jgi:hypothetical protein
MVSEYGSLGAPESLPRYYPSPKTDENIQKSLRYRLVRDRGSEVQILSPRPIPKKTREIQSG